MAELDKIAASIKDLQQCMQSMQDKLNKIMEIIIGDLADETKPGMHIRLDRLEQSNKLKNKIICLLATGVVTALGSAVFIAFCQFVSNQ